MPTPMLPTFPQMKRLELGDKDEIEEITDRFPPYSDFNFISMWLWNLNDRTRVSQLNDNLVVRLTDSRTQEPIFSFIGDRKCDDTASAIFDFLRKHDLKPELNILPEVATGDLSRGKFDIIEDRDNHDYIASTKELSALAGSKFVQLRARIRSFERNEYHFRELDTSDPATRLKMRRCAELWLGHRNDNGDNRCEKCLRAEDYAFNRLLLLPRILLDSIVSWGVFVDGVMTGFMAGGVVQDHWIFHFGKVTYRHNGTFQFLHHRTSRELLGRGVHHLNLEEDLGLPQLRFAKTRYRPTHFLKKYTVRVKGDNDAFR